MDEEPRGPVTVTEAERSAGGRSNNLAGHALDVGRAEAATRTRPHSAVLEVPDPYGEDALLTPAMVDGCDAVPAGEWERLRQYLEAVAAVRPAPVHAAVAFNAVYFGYDLKGDGYGRSPLRLDDFPQVTLGERAPALPVGAMVSIATGSDPLYAEILYKEGAHPDVDNLGDVPAWVSGAPAGAEGPGRPGTSLSPRRRELLVPDLHAFGPGLSLSSAQIHRLRTHQRWINEDGHVVIEACYTSGEAVRRDDLSAYADYLLTSARAQLLSPFVPVSLVELVGSTDDAALRAGLLRLLEVVRRALVSSDLLRMWGMYAMTRKALAACWGDDGPLGGDDMRSLAAALEHAAAPSRRRYGVSRPVTAYTAIGPRLRTFLGAKELLKGVEYAAAVCRANVAVADVVQRDSEQGLFTNGSLVVLDDVFEGGGVWRSHYPGDAEVMVDPLVPAGRGWASTVVKSPRSEPEPIDAPLADDAVLGLGELLRVGGQEVVWQFPLRLAHLIDGCLPLCPSIAAGLRMTSGRQSPVRLEIDHSAGALNEGEAVQHTVAELGDGAARLTGVHWPRDFFPGLLLRLHWSRGGRVIRLVTTRLNQPVLIGDRAIGHCYDPCVLTREDSPGSDRHGDTAAGLGPRQLVMRTVRRCGLLTLDGHALLDRSGLPVAVYGCWPPRARSDALAAAVSELLAERLLEPAFGSRDTTGRPRFPARPGERTIPLLAYRPARVRVTRPWGTNEQASERLRCVQFVPGHLRRLLPGCSPSDLQRAAFREHCRRLGKADGWELPEGYTFVTQYTRGGRPSPATPATSAN
ncbi:hypothetical protein AB0A77_08640 [Streptomyces varsoviensis]|uniref:hypothetical protein n=1 Tax=Streptomyces varsoviensis TaxID=67373 RepID=UPI0033C65DAE